MSLLKNKYGECSAITFIMAQLKAVGVEKMITTREPGGTPISEQIRQLVKHHDHDEALHSQTELLLMIASRVQLVKTVIKPALAANTWVIADRHVLSTLAYQGGGRQLDEALIVQIHQLVLGNFTPDFTLYLDIEPQLGFSRIRQRGELDRIEQEDLAFFDRTREKYLSLVKKLENVATIDASQTVMKVHQDITCALQAQYPKLFANET